MVTLKCDVHVKLDLLLVVLLTLLIYPRLSKVMALTALLGIALWGVTQMSWVTLFLRVHKW